MTRASRHARPQPPRTVRARVSRGERAKLRRPAPYCRECHLEDDALLACSLCLGSYHRGCLDAAAVAAADAVGANWSCPRCVEGRHKCVVCQQEGAFASTGSLDALIACSRPRCWSLGHARCLAREGGGSRPECPFHACGVCARASRHAPVLGCVLCPTAAHARPCLPPGALTLSRRAMVCGAHGEAVAAWCARLQALGRLPGAEAAAAQEEVADNAEAEEEEEEEELAEAEEEKVEQAPAPATAPSPPPPPPPPPLLPPVEFWIFGEPSNPGADAKLADAPPPAAPAAVAPPEDTPPPSALSAMRVTLRPRDFSLSERFMRQARERRESRPPSYRRVKVNQYGDFAGTRVGDDEQVVCECDPLRGDACDPASCMNAMAFAECTNRTCRVGPEKCRNRRLQHAQYPATKLVRTASKGWGLEAAELIAAGTLVTEYVGEVISEAQSCERLERQQHEGDSHFYMFKVNQSMVIDATHQGNLSRFVNHSCDPNCEAAKWQVGRRLRVGIYALRDIACGEELTYNYNFLGYAPRDSMQPCHCGAALCSGFLGLPPKRPGGAASSKKRQRVAAAAAAAVAEGDGEGKNGAVRAARTNPPSADDATLTASPAAGSPPVDTALPARKPARPRSRASAARKRSSRERRDESRTPRRRRTEAEAAGALATSQAAEAEAEAAAAPVATFAGAAESEAAATASDASGFPSSDDAPFTRPSPPRDPVGGSAAPQPLGVPDTTQPQALMLAPPMTAWLCAIGGVSGGVVAVPPSAL